MYDFNIGSSLKMQGYLRNQNLDQDSVNFLSNVNLKTLMSEEEYESVSNDIRKYHNIQDINRQSPTVEASKALQELSQDILYNTGKSAESIKISDLHTFSEIEQILGQSNIRSKNDLFVQIDYDNYSSQGNVVKCKVVGHDAEFAYGISANAKMVVTNDGDIFCMRNSLYCK